MDVNTVVLTGRLTRDPELRRTKNDLEVCTFTIAVNNGFGENKRVGFYRVVCFKGTAVNIEKYCSKGSHICVVGKLTEKKWQNKEGETKYSVEVIANQVTFLSKKGDSVQSSGGGSPEPDNKDLQPDDEIPF